METGPDTHRSAAEVPELGTDAQKNEFCAFIKHYNALCNVGGEAEVVRSCNQAISWLNRMTASEPIVSPVGMVMVDFLFEEAHFLAAESGTRDYYKSLVASNVIYLVMAELNQCKRAREIW